MGRKSLRIRDRTIVYTEAEIQDIYKDVLKEIRCKFPKYFWFDGCMVNLYHAKIVTKFLIEDILNWDKDQVTKNFSSDLLRQYKLNGMMSNVFGNSPMAVLENTYPGKYDPKEMQETFMQHDDKVLLKESIRLRKLCKGLSHEEIVKLYNNAFCLKHRFATIMHNKEADVDKFQLLDTAFPGEFFEWEFIVPAGFWTTGENRKRATLWLMKKEGTKALTARQFAKNGMPTLPTHGKGVNNTICEALGIQEEEYREDFYKLLCQCHNNGIKLSEELDANYHAINAWIARRQRPRFKFVIENYDRLVEISKRTENTPEGLYQKILEGKVGKFPSKYWKREDSYESAAKITRYAIEQVLHWGPVEVMTMLYSPVLEELKLDGMFNVLFRFDREQVIANAYPGIAWENRKFQLQCTQWLINKTGKLVPSIKDFIRHKLHPIIKLADRDDLVRELHDLQNIDCLYELERFRTQYCLSVETFATMAGISPATVYYVMNGSSQLSLEIEIRIMQAIINQESKRAQSGTHAEGKIKSLH